jgi:Domain of unknown function (DUF4129)
VTNAALLLVVAVTATGGAAAPAAPASGAAPGDPFPRKDVPTLVKQVYQREIPYCSNPRYPLTADEVRWCALIPKDDPRCPALARACTRGATAEVVFGRPAGKKHESPSFSLPMSPLPIRMLLWIILGLVVAFIIRTIIKAALAQRKPDPEPVEVATTAPEDPAAAVARQVETDVQRLLERARAAAAAGDFAAAVGDAYAALLRKLEGGGVITVESHRTNGDHVRDVSRQLPALRPRMQTVVNNIEEVQFGGGAPTEARFRSVMLDVVGLLSERLATGLVLLAKLGLALGLAGTLTSCKLNRDRWEQSTSGDELVVDLLRRYGFTPRERLTPFSKLDKSVSSLVLLPGANVDDNGWDAIANWVGEGGALFVAGGTHKLPPWIGAAPAAAAASKTAASTARAPLTVPSDQHERLPNLTADVPDGYELRLSSSETSQASPYGDENDAPPSPLVVRGRALYAVERVYEGGGRTVVLADDQLLDNVSLLVGDNALLLVELLRPGGQKLELAGELTGLVSQNPISSVRHGRLAPALLQLLLLIVLFFIYKGAQFGRPIDPVAANRRAFSEHARAIGLLYGRRRAGRSALEMYGTYALDRMRERLNLTGGRGLLAVAEEVASRTGRPLGEVMRLLVESRPPNQRPVDLERDAILQEANSAKDLAMLRDLATLLATTGGGSERTRAQRKA